MTHINDAWTSRLIGVLLASLLVGACTIVAQAQSQGETIPEAIARGASGRTSTAHSGKSPTVSEILADAELVVRGTVGEPRSYLSSDKRDVYTDYPLVASVVLYQRTARTAQKPGQLGITVTQLGGKVMVGKVEFTQTELGLPPLMRGTEGIFILELRDGKYHIARTFYGVFAILNNTVKPLTSKHDFAPEYRDVPTAAVLGDLTSRLRSLK
jgi:hypothetical protein